MVDMAIRNCNPFIVLLFFCQTWQRKNKALTSIYSFLLFGVWFHFCCKLFMLLYANLYC